MFKYIWFISIGGTLWCKTINIRGIMLVGFSLHGEHGKDNPNKPWSLSCKASDYRGLGDGTLVFLASNFLDHGCENIKPVFDFLKSGTDTVCKRHGLRRGNQTKSNDWCRYFIYLVSLNHNSLGLAPHAAVNLVSDTHAHFVHPGKGEYMLSDLRTHAGGEGCPFFDKLDPSHNHL